MAKAPRIEDHQDTFRRLEDVRARAIEHTKIARQLHHERRGIIGALIDSGFSQADIARELGVTRQAIQKMMRL
jgi:hypothetical protein